MAVTGAARSPWRAARFPDARAATSAQAARTISARGDVTACEGTHGGRSVSLWANGQAEAIRGTGFVML